MATDSFDHPARSGAAGSATFAGSDSRKYNYFEPKGRKATHYEDMTVDVQPDPERYLLQDWIINFPDGTPTYSKDWTEVQKQQLARVPRRRPGMGEDPLSAPVDDLRHGSKRHRERPQVGRLHPLRQGLGQGSAGSSRCLQARRVRPGHIDHAGAALRLHADDQQRHPDQLVLQAALCPGFDALLGEIGLDIPGLRRQRRQDSIGWRIRSGRARAAPSKRSWARPTTPSSTSRRTWCSSRSLASCSAAASSCRWPRHKATSSRRRSYRLPKPTTSVISPTRSNTFTC